MCFIKCIINGLFIGIKIIKGRNSGQYKITRNKGDFRDCVCLKPLNGFECKITLHDDHDIQTTYEGKLSNILQG